MYADWKVRENYIKTTVSLESQRKSGNFEKMLCLVRESQGTFFVKIFDLRVTNYCHLEIKIFNNSISFYTFRMYVYDNGMQYFNCIPSIWILD